MRNDRNPPHRRTLVLGGGGAVGVGWQVGFLNGLRELGVDFTTADEILGTSAGALVGALLASDRDVGTALIALGALRRNIESATLAAGNEGFLIAMREASRANDRQQFLRYIGRSALEAETLAEAVYLTVFDVLDGSAWPAGFRCTAIDAATGELKLWDSSSGVPLREAVASSCAVPALFPPVTIYGRRYIDGGLISHLNATSTTPTDMLVVLSCHPLTARGAVDHDALTTSRGAAEAEVAAMRNSTRVRVIEPDFGELQIGQDMMMDPAVAARAVGFGQRQAHQEAVGLSAAWSQ